jgi:Ser/Thr protein kinase RdoA (MazF antagonist)
MFLSENTPYENLSPSLIMDAVETIGVRCTGAVFALNSYENRVYDIALEGADNIVAKFYRPHRWTREQIEEEHIFAHDLYEAEVDVVPPMVFDGKTLFEYENYLFCVYPKRSGQPIELTTDEDYRHMGRLVARIHAVGAQKDFVHRLAINPKNYGWDNIAFLEKSGYIPEDMAEGYISTATHLLQKIDTIWGDRTFTTRIHGDCHLGNILKSQDVFFVDLDDSLTGPEVQDLWMMVSGEKNEMEQQFRLLIEGYTQIRDFDASQLILVESLRSLRMIHMVAWVARRWQDPAFTKRFAEFTESTYWQNNLLQLKEQMAILDEPHISV